MAETGALRYGEGELGWKSVLERKNPFEPYCLALVVREDEISESDSEGEAECFISPYITHQC